MVEGARFKLTVGEMKPLPSTDSASPNHHECDRTLPSGAFAKLAAVSWAEHQ